jgi:hypothetical protein
MFQEIRFSADKGNYAEFVELMGGVFCIRNEQAIRPFYSIEFDKETGETKTSYFDSVPTKKIKVVSHNEKYIVTCEHTWCTKRREELRAA